MTLFLMLALAIGPAYDLDHRLTDGGAPVHEIETNSVGRVTVVVSRPRSSLQPRRGNARTIRVPAGVDYYATVDSYNESGVTRGAKTVSLPATEGLVEGYDMRGDSPSPAIVNRMKGVAVHEAEKAVTVGKGMKGEYEVRASAAMALWGFGPKGTSVTFRDVAAPSSGTGTLRLSYATPFPARVALVVNGGAPIEVDLPATRGWPTFMTLDIPLAGQCLRKTNDIRLEGCGETLSLDYIQVF